MARTKRRTRISFLLPAGVRMAAGPNRVTVLAPEPCLRGARPARRPRLTPGHPRRLHRRFLRVSSGNWLSSSLAPARRALQWGREVTMSRGELQHGLPQPIQGRGANRLALVPWTRHGRRHWPRGTGAAAP